MFNLRKLLVGWVAVTGLILIGPAASGFVKTDVERAVPIALLVDIQSGQTLLSQNADRRFIPASITKVMSAYVAFEMLATGSITLDQEFLFGETASEQWYRTGSTMFLEPGETINVDTLLKGITSVSANDASIVLAEGAAGSVDNWVRQMNSAANSLGMHDTHFGTPNGWPDGGKTFTTARDLERLAKAIIAKHPSYYDTYFGQSGFRHNGFSQANHDPISGVINGADGIKTGYTNQAGYNFLGSAKRGNTRLIMILGGVGTEAERADIARKSMEWGFDGFERRMLFSKGSFVTFAKVQNSDQDLIRLRAATPINVVMPRDYVGLVRLNLIYEGPLKAPISKGETLAELEILVDGLPPARVPLVADDQLAKADPIQRISNAFTGWTN